MTQHGDNLSLRRAVARLGRLIAFVGGLAVALLSPGCVTPVGGPEASANKGLRPITPPAGSIALDLVWLVVPDEEAGQLGPLWDEIDEQPIVSAARRGWHENGLRVGLVGTHLPSAIRTWLDGQQARTAVEQLSEEGNDESQTVSIRKRDGGTHSIACTGLFPEWTILTRRRNELTGLRLEQASGALALKLRDDGHEGARLELTPEVHHGQPRQRAIGAEGGYRYETVRPKEIFDDLRVSVTLMPGQTLIFGSTPEERGLGERFFRDRDGRHRLLLIRLASAGDDVLVQPRAIAAPGI